MYHDEKCANALRDYNRAGWKAIPAIAYVGTDEKNNQKRFKQPTVSWRRFIDNHPTPSEIENWCKGGVVGVAVLTGKYAEGTHVCGVDFDQKDGKPDYSQFVDVLMEGMYTITAGGGRHYYFKTSTPQKNATNIFNADKKSDQTIIDIRGEGGIVIVGPTILWSGDPRNEHEHTKELTRYKTPVITPPDELSELPSIFSTSSRASYIVGEKAWKEVFDPENRTKDRHDIAKSLVGKLLVGVDNREEANAIMSITKAILKSQFKERFDTPEGDSEIDRLCEWVMEREKKDRTAEYASMTTALKRKGLVDWEESFGVISLKRLGDSVEFVRQNDAFMVRADDVLTQNRVKTAFFLKTGIALPTITHQAFLKIMSQIPLEEGVGTDTTFEEIIEDVLCEKAERSDFFESNDEAIETAKNRRYAKLKEGDKEYLMFRLNRLITDVAQEWRSVSRSKLRATLKNIATSKTIKNKQFWLYEL